MKHSKVQMSLFLLGLSSVLACASTIIQALISLGYVSFLPSTIGIYCSALLGTVGIAIALWQSIQAGIEMDKKIQESGPSDGNTRGRAERQKRWMRGDLT